MKTKKRELLNQLLLKNLNLLGYQATVDPETHMVTLTYAGKTGVISMETLFDLFYDSMDFLRFCINKQAFSRTKKDIAKNHRIF